MARKWGVDGVRKGMEDGSEEGKGVEVEEKQVKEEEEEERGMGGGGDRESLVLGSLW